MPIKRKCAVCKNNLITYPSHIKAGRGKYCSKRCQSISPEFRNKISQSRKGKSSWSKGKKFSNLHRKRMSIARLGWTPSIKTRKIMSINSSGSNSHFWKGGKIKKWSGHIMIHKPKHPQSTGNGYVPEHRFIIEKFIKRFLRKKEVVHHINKIPNDNRITNLMVFKSNSAHIRFHRNPGTVTIEDIAFDGRLI